MKNFFASITTTYTFNFTWVLNLLQFRYKNRWFSIHRVKLQLHFKCQHRLIVTLMCQSKTKRHSLLCINRKSQSSVGPPIMQHQKTNFNNFIYMYWWRIGKHNDNAILYPWFFVHYWRLVLILVRPESLL